MNKAWIRVALSAVLLVGAEVARAQEPSGERIHAVGYSVTYNSICGAVGLFFLDPFGQECLLYSEYGGGTAPVWYEQIPNPSSLKWGLFEEGIEVNGQPSVVYWQIGFIRQRSAEIAPAGLAALIAIADEIRSRAPGATIYVSGMSAYEPRICERVTPQSVEKSWNAAGLLWGSSPDIQPGPVLPSITPEQTAGSGDTCHLGPVGKALHGAVLRDFFDGVLATP